MIKNHGTRRNGRTTIGFCLKTYSKAKNLQAHSHLWLSKTPQSGNEVGSSLKSHGAMAVEDSIALCNGRGQTNWTQIEACMHPGGIKSVTRKNK